MATRAIIFDFDGVLADSEALANRVLANLLTACGAPTTLEQSYAAYMGKRLPEIVAAANARHGVDLPDDFPDRLLDATLAAFRRDLRAVPGAPAFVRGLGRTPKAIASSSSPPRLAFSLEIIGLAEDFGRHVYSAQQFPRGKPHPDIFLHAAAGIGAAPQDCVVIEDSISGVQAGVAAGMRVIGLLAGAHVQTGHADALAQAGAWRVATDFASVKSALEN